jgi:hypothetical protein
MRYRLRTLLIVMTAACMLCGWHVFLRRMAAYHRVEADKAVASLDGPNIQTADLQTADGNKAWEKLHKWEQAWPANYRLFSHHLKKSNDFDHAFLRPWLVFFDCKPGSLFGTPTYSSYSSPMPAWMGRNGPPPIYKRLPSRDDGSVDPIASTQNQNNGQAEYGR